ncbi:cysteine desulfurase NifS [Thermanaerosceptrum fracticalcis]|uniref:Cysteine desulfurase IscS n=1 Tax=Thermanaerosceptrum fracticalcis TaxID=1712410 RepID=A0A7G6DZQ3_THEFR|nr:cysteine desulfurase NifS [Thermanaerosceptrum fracticalcis]QNB45307.1 cysteine desulfurase NifS [Thermanaerosceptrum fracticalcis]
MRRVYLDHSATTPVRPEVAQIVLEYMTNKFGNPSSVHVYGREAKQGLEKAREQVAKLINAKPEEIIFTSGGTEADNLAITGIAQTYANKGKHIITSAVEHHAVLDTCKNLEKLGYTVTVLPVDEYGIIKLEDLKKAITKETILITIMHANNEVGSIQPVAEIGKIAKENGVIFHTDAVQSLGKIPVDVDKMNIDLLSGSGHKIYAPKGIGFLYIRRGVGLKPLTFGGGQERRRRPGTENLPGIVGLGLAAELAGKEMETEMPRIAKLRDRLIAGIMERIPHVRLNGHPQERVPNNVNVSFEFVEGESLLLSLDMKGIAASSGSACTSGSLDPSHVLMAMGICHEIAHGSVRMTLGKANTEEDIDYVLEVLPPIVERLRLMSPLYQQQRKECQACTLKK